MFPQIFGKYVLEREIAAGGMARVYLATLRGAVGFEKRLVVKQIRPELASDEGFVQRFVSEAKTAVGLSHPNIVAVYELGVEQGVYYIAMELCPGVTLSEVLAATGKLSPEEGAYVGVEICRALDYAHRRAGIVHRDVTPRNVLIDEEGAVRLIDFGIAAVASGEGKHEVFGSPGHMPPEQLAGQSLTPATDVFAVAALLTEAWTGHAPFRRETARESNRALSEPVPLLSAQNDELSPISELVARGLALDPKTRPADAEGFARPLRDFLRSADVGDVARRLGERVRQAARRSRRERPSTPPLTAEGDGSGRPSQPSAPSTLTRTFAQRDEVTEWTRRISEPAPATGPSTRKLPSLAPGAGDDEARPEGPATRSLEPARTGSGPAPSIERASAPRTSRKRVTQGLLLVAAGALLGTAVLRGTQLLDGASVPSAEPRSASNPAVTAAHRPASNAPASAFSPSTSNVASSSSNAPASAAKARPELPAPSAATPPATEPRAELAARGRPPASSREPRAGAPGLYETNGSAALRLTADPVARVSVQGGGLSRVLTTPVRELKLPPGAYTVRFESTTYASPVSAHVTLRDGALRSVHADFREAEPRISVR